MEDTLKTLKFIMILLAILISYSLSDAGKLYIWTDKNGQQHITEQPPPTEVKKTETLEYRKKTPAEEAADREARRQREERDRQRCEQQSRIRKTKQNISKQAVKTNQDFASQNAEMIKAEKYRLKRKIQHLEDRARTAKPKVREMNKRSIAEIEKDLRLLSTSPEQYFLYQKQKREVRQSRPVSIGIDIETGNVVTTVPLN